MAVDDNLIREAVAELQLLAVKKPLEGVNLSSHEAQLKNLFSLGVILDDKETILKRKMNAIYHWLLTNGLRL